MTSLEQQRGLSPEEKRERTEQEYGQGSFELLENFKIIVDLEAKRQIIDLVKALEVGRVGSATPTPFSRDERD